MFSQKQLQLKDSEISAKTYQNMFNKTLLINKDFPMMY